MVWHSKKLCEHLKNVPKQATSNTSQFLEAYKGFNRKSVSYEQLIDITVKCGECGNLLKRRHWNRGTPWKIIVWQCKSYIDNDGNRCPSKAIKDVELKQAFIRLYNNMVKDKGSFFRSFYNNVEKIIGINSVSANIDKLTVDINTFENDLSELIQLNIRHQIDDIFYNKEYQRNRSELDDLFEKKESLRRSLMMSYLKYLWKRFWSKIPNMWCLYLRMDWNLRRCWRKSRNRKGILI